MKQSLLVVNIHDLCLNTEGPLSSVFIRTNMSQWGNVAADDPGSIQDTHALVVFHAAGGGGPRHSYLFKMRVQDQQVQLLLNVSMTTSRDWTTHLMDQLFEREIPFHIEYGERLRLPN